MVQAQLAEVRKTNAALSQVISELSTRLQGYQQVPPKAGGPASPPSASILGCLEGTWWEVIPETTTRKNTFVWTFTPATDQLMTKRSDGATAQYRRVSDNEWDGSFTEADGKKRFAMFVVQDCATLKANGDFWFRKPAVASSTGAK